jgi:hypothetical protein
MPRRDTSLESAGAEFLVLGQLLIEGIQASKAYTNFPGYDIIATAPENHRSCRIQVKSRWAIDSDGGFPIRNFDCDFVACVALNRGFQRKTSRHADDIGRRPPCFYVFPVDVIRDAQNPRSKLGKAFLRNINNVDYYVDNWELIRNFLCSRMEDE